MDSGYGTSATGRQLDWLKSQLAAKTYSRKFALYNRSIYPYCKPTTPFDFKKMAEDWTPVFQDNKFTAAFEMGDGGFRVSKALKDGKVVPDFTEGSVFYLGQGQLTPWQHNHCSVMDWDKDTVEFSAHPVTSADQSDDKMDVMDRADSYYKSYFMVQLFNKDNFAIGTNGNEVMMSRTFNADQ